MVVNKGGPGLELLDKKGKTRFQVAMRELILQDGTKTLDPESTLNLTGPDGKVI